MFNVETVQFLKLFNKISNSVILQYPITVGRTESADIAYKVDLSKLDTDGFEGSIGLFNLSNFLSIFNLVDKTREINLKDNLITLKDENTKLSYLTTYLEVLAQYEFKPEQFDKNAQYPTVLEMQLTANDIKKLKNAASVFTELDQVVITSKEETTLSLSQSNNFKTSSNVYEFKKDANSSKNFAISITLDTLAKIPEVDYECVVKYNESRDAYRIVLSTEIFSLIVSGKNIGE